MDTDIQMNDTLEQADICAQQEGEQPRTAVVMGPTCKRSALLQEAFDKALAYGLRDPSREDFGDNFPDLDEQLVDALYDTFKQTLTLVRSHCQAEFQQVCTEHQVHEQPRALEQTEGTHASTSGTPLPPGATLQRMGDSRQAGAMASGVDSTGASAGVVCGAEAAARLHALRQEATYLQDMLERARATEARLVEALALRQGTMDKMAATYNRVVSDVKQVYDITRVWPAAPRLGGKPA